MCWTYRTLSVKLDSRRTEGHALRPGGAAWMRVVTGVGAVLNTAHVSAGDSVVIFGAGGVGLNAISGARIAGASRIVAVDLQPKRLEAAKSFGRPTLSTRRRQNLSKLFATFSVEAPIMYSTSSGCSPSLSRVSPC